LFDQEGTLLLFLICSGRTFSLSLDMRPMNESGNRNPINISSNKRAAGNHYPTIINTNKLTRNCSTVPLAAVLSYGPPRTTKDLVSEIIAEATNDPHLPPVFGSPSMACSTT